MHLIAGDTIIDWIIQDNKTIPTVGGAGNIVRGLTKKGHDIEFLTLYNPSLYPLSYAATLHPNSLTDVNHTNVFVRDYDKEVFHRFRHGLQSSVLDVKKAIAVICHEDSIIRRFESFYADVRDTSVKGKTYVLRMSSSDDYARIMTKVEHDVAIVTGADYVKIKGLNSLNQWREIKFERVDAKDDIGAGDTFNVGFLHHMIQHHFDTRELATAVLKGIELAQEKVQKVGVFL